MLQRLLHTLRANTVEVGVAIPIGCMVPLAIAAPVLVGAGVLLGQRFQPAPADNVVVRVYRLRRGGWPARGVDPGRTVALMACAVSDWRERNESNHLVHLVLDEDAARRGHAARSFCGIRPGEFGWVIWDTDKQVPEERRCGRCYAKLLG